MAFEPGKTYAYNSGATQILAHVFRVATGMDIEDYAVRHLFTPLGIKQFYWKRSPSGLVDAEGGIYLRPRDLAKLWYLFLQGGKWQGKQIVSPEWVKDSLTPHMDLGPNAKYGLKWWLYPYGPDNKFLAWGGSGFGGQRPLVLAEYDMVAVYTAWNVNPGPGLRTKESIDRLIGMVTDGKTPSGPSQAAAEPQKTTLDQVLEYLLSSAATDFHTHRPPYPERFRNVRIGHTTSASGEAVYSLCGEFREAGKSEWSHFATIKTSGYEQWLGSQSKDYCQGRSFVWDKKGDLSSSLKSRLDSIR